MKTMNFIDYTDLITDFAVNFISIYFMAYMVLYKKYRNTEMFITCTLFNLFVLIIVMALIRTNFNIAAGFGLFALLSLIQLRSAQFTKTEIGYLFGSVALAVLNGIGIIDFGFVIILNLVIISTTWFIASWSLEHSANLIKIDNVRKMSVTLDQIDEEAISHRSMMKDALTKKLGVNIQSFEIKKIDYVRDIVYLSVLYLIPENEKPQFMDNVGTQDHEGKILEIGD
jgi:hypothetical protein